MQKKLGDLRRASETEHNLSSKGLRDNTGSKVLGEQWRILLTRQAPSREGSLSRPFLSAKTSCENVCKTAR